jgi:hypothetical protein
MSRDIKIVQLKTQVDKQAERDSENRAEMVSMLEETLEGVKDGSITGFVFIGRKRIPQAIKTVSPSSKDYFEYIVANALDIGLIGEIQVFNNRLIALYDQYTDGVKDEEPKE